jgi:geranylgeranyldiphosphate transferase
MIDGMHKSKWLQKRLLVRVRRPQGLLGGRLRNRELNYPIILALNVPGGEKVERALEFPMSRNIRRAMGVIQSSKISSL